MHALHPPEVSKINAPVFSQSDFCPENTDEVPENIHEMSRRSSNVTVVV